MGTTKVGAFEIPGEKAREWLGLPNNPSGRSNSEVLRPWFNGLDLTRRPRDIWVIDFGAEMIESAAALYEAPFEYAKQHVKPERLKNRREAYAKAWWRHGEARPAMRRALTPLSRFIATPEVAKHRVFAWLPTSIIPDHKLQVIAREDDVTFGVLHAHLHEIWALALGSWHGVGNDPRYTITTTFETFPFPEGVLSDPNPDARFPTIAEAARRLVELRDNWLNPPQWVKRVPEVVPGYPDRRLPVDDQAAAELKKRTLTNLYNQRPTWLANSHRDLDAAVAAAYGWPADLSDDEILRRLLELNLERAGKNG